MLWWVSDEGHSCIGFLPEMCWAYGASSCRLFFYHKLLQKQVCLFVWYRASISLISGSLPIISCAIMMSLFCCKDTKNIVSRKIVIGRIVFISRGNVRKNNGFPRLMWGCQQDLRCTGYLYIRWKLQRRRRCSMAPTMCSWQICGIRSIWVTVVISGYLFPGKMVCQCWKNNKK